MGVWRQKAIACLPEKRAEFENPDSSIYDVFRKLLPATIDAHKRNEMELLKSFYGFAEWCFRQNAKELWNAAGVYFYEHLYGNKETKESFSKWVRKDIYHEIKVLLELSVSKKELEELDIFYKYLYNCIVEQKPFLLHHIL